MKIEHDGVTITQEPGEIRISCNVNGRDYTATVNTLNTPEMWNTALNIMIDMMTENFRHRATIAVMKFRAEQK